ncbi:MAG: hypothetical protein H6557_10330 [Lewinellaceae bacterium]|nr:hypothetical protein [Phaeodactylibacter sp.]MCB9037006.1 hypothetical protein [Lewinellaceae bacterium]
MPLPTKLRSFFHYLLLAAGGLFAVLVFLTGLVYYIAVSDQERVPAIVEEVFRENLGADATFAHYSFQYFDHFPFLSLSLEDVAMRDPCFDDHGRELLRIKKVSAVFRPWKLLRREFELRSIAIDSARIQLYRSPDGYFNASFLEKDSIAFLRGLPGASASFSIDKVKVNGLFFDFQDVPKGKHFRIEVRQSDIGFSPSDNGRRLFLRGKWFFHGLHFKLENGPYFREQESRLALHVEWGGPRGGIRLLPSFAVFGKDTLHLEGAFEAGDTNYVRLAIRSPGILLDNARPLLADNLQKSLKPFTIGQPVPVAVNIEGPLLPGQSQPMEVDFQIENDVLATKTLRLTAATLRGRYVNNCDPSGTITSHSDCLDIELLAAKLFDTVDVRATYHAEDMKAPKTEVKATLEAALADINGLLPPGQFRFRSGEGTVALIFSGRMDNPLATPAEQADIALSGEGRISQAALDYLPTGMSLNDINADFSFDKQNLSLHNLQLRIGENPYQLRGSIYGLMASLMGEKEKLFARLDVHTPHLDFGSFLSPGQEEAPGNARKGSAGKGLMSRLDAQFRVAADEVSYRKLEAADVGFAGRWLSACTAGEGPCLLIDSLSATIFDNIPVHASFQLDELDDPRMNMNLRLAMPLADLNQMLPPDKLRLNSGDLELKLRYRGRLDAYATLDVSALKGELRGEASIAGGAADYFPRGYEFRDFAGAFHFDANDLIIDSLGFVLNGNQASARGTVQGLLPFVFSPDKKIRAALSLATPELDLNRFPGGVQRAAAGDKPPARPTRITRVLEAALGAVEGELSVTAGKLYYHTLSLGEVAFQGRLSQACEGQEAANGCATVEKLSAKIFGTAPFQATLKATNFQDPFFVADVQVDMPLAELNRMFAPGQFRFDGGAVSVGFHYEGRPNGHFDVENALLKARLKGEGHITEGAFDYKPRGYRFREVNTHFAFDEDGLFIKDVQLLLNDNKMQGSGKFNGFLPFLFLPGRELEASLEVSAGAFDFGNFKAPQKFLQPSGGRPQDSTAVTRLVNAGLESINAHLHLSIDSVKYRNFRAAKVKGELTVKPGMWRFEDTEMALCDGTFRLSGQVGGLEKNKPDIDVQVQFRNTDIRKVFLAFDNFGQEGLTAQNIEGQLNADIRFSARANANYDLLPASMKGEFGVKVEDGALINLPALDSLQGFLLRSRGLSNIQFATLENAFELQGQDLLIDHFFVASTALSFGVEGRYALGKGTDTDLLFEVPVANLFWQGKEVDALEKLHQRKRGLSILLRATEKEEGGLNFKWVLSKH